MSEISARPREFVLMRLQPVLWSGGMDAFGWDSDEDELVQPPEYPRPGVCLPWPPIPYMRHNERRIAFTDLRGLWCHDIGRLTLEPQPVPDGLMAQIRRVIPEAVSV